MTDPGVNLRRVSVAVSQARGEQARAVMLELFPDGFEELDSNGALELVAYTNAAGEERIWQAFGGAASAADVDENWEERWRQFHRPQRVGSLWIGPPWERPDADAIPVVIDPGRAFGTGAHATTRGCLELLLELAEEGERGSLCDLGCGSGVLSIAAARLGFGPVTALDSDPLAIEATMANARDNGVRLDRLGRANLREQPAPTADFVTANLMCPLLLRVAELMEDRPRALIASGLLDHEADKVAAAFSPLRERRRVLDQGWCALLLRAP